MDKTRIIVVEDNIVYCEYVCNLLAREGYSTVKAYHLSTAKKHLQQATDDDIVVSDLRLNDGNGIDLLRWMRKHETRFDRLYSEETDRGQTRPPYPLHTERASVETQPDARFRP